MFGASVYMGLWWALHVIWYPSWRAVKLDSVQEHFINPIDHAITFFTILVCIMSVTNIIMIIVEWKTKFRWLSIITLILLFIVTYLFKSSILPVINEIRAGLPNQEALAVKMKEWMFLNDVRWAFYSVIWALFMFYFLAKRYQKPYTY
jgi:hypothetical protein